MSKLTQTVEETSKYMWRNEKNRLFMGIMIILMLVYVLLFAPDFNRHHDMDVEDLQYEMTGNAVQAQNAKDKGYIVPSVMTGTTAYIEQQHEFGQQRELYTTIQQGDVQRYLETYPLREIEEPETNLATLFYGLFEEDPLFMKSQRYIEEVPHLNFHVIHEITSLQQLHLFLIGAGPLILFSGLIFMISDVHTKDLGIASQKSGIPLNWSTYLLVQSLTALGFVVTFYLVFFGLFYLINGLLHGFGSLSYPISFPYETIGWFFIRALPFLCLLFLLFTRLNTLISLWTRQSIVTMGILIFIVFFSSIYMDAYTAETVPFNLSLLPTSYISFGKVLTGRHSLAPPVSGLTVYSSGLIVLAATWLLTELTLYLTTKRMTRQKFITKGAN